MNDELKRVRKNIVWANRDTAQRFTLRIWGR